MEYPESRRSAEGGGLLRARGDAHDGPTRRMTLPRLTTCYEHERIRPSLTGRRLMHALFLCAVVASFGIAHVHLRFRTADLRLQTQHLQAQARQLQARIVTLERQNTALAGLDHLHTLAVETLGMIPIAAENMIVAEMPQRLVERYRSIRREQEPQPDQAPRPNPMEDAVLAALPLQAPPEFLDAVLQIGRAFAAVTGVQHGPENSRPPDDPAAHRVVEFRFVEP